MTSASTNSSWPDTIAAWVERRRLLTPGAAVLVAVSGGADSVALLRVLHRLTPRWSLSLTVAHVHHGVRGASADADQAFVEQLAAQHGLPCVVMRISPSGHDEAALREARYDALLVVARQVGATVMATGHTLDDHAETVLMRLIRGTGPSGLRGIPVAGRRQGMCLVRPLRGVWRAEVEAWLRAESATWRDDATNASPTYLRNRIRHELLPLLATYNPQIKPRLAQLADVSDAQWTCLQEQAVRWLDAHAVPTAEALTLPRQPLAAAPLALQQLIVREAVCRRQGHLRQLTYQHWLEMADLLAERPAGSVVDLPDGLQALTTTEWLILRDKNRLRHAGGAVCAQGAAAA